MSLPTMTGVGRIVADPEPGAPLLMTTTTLPQPTTNTTGNNDLNHVYCCNPNTALCGTDTTDARDDDTADITCIVCADLIWDNTPCSPACDIHTWA